MATISTPGATSISASTMNADYTGLQGPLPTPPVSPMAYQQQQWPARHTGLTQMFPGMATASMSGMQQQQPENTQFINQLFAPVSSGQQADIERLLRENAILRAQINMGMPPLSMPLEAVAMSTPSIAHEATPPTEHVHPEQQSASLAHFAGTQSTYERLKAFNLPMNPDGTFKIVTYEYKGHEHHPYWFPDAWKNRRDKVVKAGQTQRKGHTALEDGETVETFLTNPDGSPVDSTRAKEIRSYAYSIWRDHARDHGVAALPKTWKPASTQFKLEFTRLILGKAPELGFCHGGWHSAALAQGCFSQWRSNFLASVDPRTVSDALLVEEILRAKAKRDKQLDKRRIKRSIQKAASLDAATYTIKADADDDEDPPGSSKRNMDEEFDPAGGPAKRARTMSDILAHDTTTLDVSLTPVPTREDFDFEYLPLPDSAPVPIGDTVASGLAGPSVDNTKLVSDTPLGNALISATSTASANTTVSGTTAPLDAPLDSSTTTESPGSTSLQDIPISIGNAIDLDAICDSSHPARVPLATPLAAATATHLATSAGTGDLGDLAGAGDLDLDTPAHHAPTVASPAPLDTPHSAEDAEGRPKELAAGTLGDMVCADGATTQPARTRVANPFTAILSDQPRILLPPARIAPVPPPKVKKPKTPKASEAWPPVRKEDSAQKEETGGTREDFNKFYAELKSDGARKKWKNKREPPAGGPSHGQTHKRGTKTIKSNSEQAVEQAFEQAGQQVGERTSE
ncbi:hypothetical protein C8T65DRAFT_696037 [Cerioporus squamosus]|nr:hypothetical protein C8T65DRAFT_696037 [Cerioporus squamosus]